MEQILDPKDTGKVHYRELVNMINHNNYWDEFFAEKERKEKEEVMKETKKGLY